MNNIIRLIYLSKNSTIQGRVQNKNPSSHWEGEGEPVTTSPTIQNRSVSFGKPAYLPITAAGIGEPGSLWMTRLLGNYNPEWLRGEDERRGPREIYSSLSHLSLCRSDPWSDILKTTVSKPTTTNPQPQRTQRHLSPGKKHRATKLVYAAREQMAFPTWSCSRCIPLRTAFQNQRSRLE